jgi:hypothetical protein
MRAGRKRVTEFGKRGIEMVEPTERKLTLLNHLKYVGMRWWGTGRSRKTTTASAKGFRRTRLAP